MLAVAPLVRASDADVDRVEWVAPASFDEVPVRAAIEIAPESVAPKPIVVPLPSALGPGGILLATIAAARWRSAARRRRR